MTIGIRISRIENPAYQIEDGGVWVADMWHGDTGEVIGWHRLSDVAYCVTSDCHQMATHAVALFSINDVLIQDVAVCKTHAAPMVFGHRDDQYAISRELKCPGLMEEVEA